MLWPENKTLVQLGGYGEAGANPARFRHRDAPARQSGLCAVLPPGAQSGYRAQLAYNAHGAMGCVQKSAAWHRALPRAVRRRFVPPFRFQPGRQGNICPPFRSVQTKPPTAAVRPATGAFLFPAPPVGQGRPVPHRKFVHSGAFFRGALFKSACGPWAGPLLGGLSAPPRLWQKGVLFCKKRPGTCFWPGLQKREVEA